MSSINIGGQQNDAFYRYKMPKLQAVIDRRNHGGATVLVNIEEVAKALHRPAICMSAMLFIPLLMRAFTR